MNRFYQVPHQIIKYSWFVVLSYTLSRDIMSDSTKPLLPSSGVVFDGFNENVNTIHCCLTINSATVYTYTNADIVGLVNLNFSEIISSNLGLMNGFQDDTCDSINIGNYSINGNYLDMCLYYNKKVTNTDDIITIFILCSDKLMKNFVYNVLDILMKEYINNYNTNDMNFEFKLRMKAIIEEEENKLRRIMSSYGSLGTEISEVRELMSDNIDKVLQRGENLESLIDKTSALSTNANYFKRKTTSVKRKFWWSNVRFWVILGSIVIIFVYVLLGLECGLPFYSHCLHPNKPNQPNPSL